MTEEFILKKQNQVLKVISKLQEIENSKTFFMNGGCFLFYIIMRDRFPFEDVEPFYDEDHIIVKMFDKYYDITGEVQRTTHTPLYEESKNIKFFGY